MSIQVQEIQISKIQNYEKFIIAEKRMREIVAQMSKMQIPKIQNYEEMIKIVLQMSDIHIPDGSEIMESLVNLYSTNEEDEYEDEKTEKEINEIMKNLANIFSNLYSKSISTNFCYNSAARNVVYITAKHLGYCQDSDLYKDLLSDYINYDEEELSDFVFKIWGSEE